MLKRIISIILATTMLLAMCVTVSAASIETVEPYELATWDGKIVTSAGSTTHITTASESVNYYCNSGVSDRTLVQTAGSGTGNVQSVLKEGTTDDYYVSNSSSKLFRSRPSSRFDLFSQMTNANLGNGKTVLSIQYDIRIPDDANASKQRTFKPTISADTSGGTPSNFTINYADGQFGIDTTSFVGIADNYVVDVASYTPGNWETVEVRVYYDTTTKKLSYSAYVGEKQIFYGEGNITYDALRLYEALWTHDGAITTCYDNIKYRLLEPNDKPEVFTVEVPEPPVVITDILNYNFDELTTDTLTSPAAVNSGKLFTTKKFIHSAQASTADATEYAGESREDNGMALVVKTINDADLGLEGGISAVVNQPRGTLGDYISEVNGEESVIVMSYDIYVPEESKASSRKHYISFYGNTSDKANDLIINSYIDNGVLSFDIEGSNAAKVKEVDFSERTKNVPITTDSWETVYYILKTVYDTDHYDVSIYGMYKGVCYYENKVVISGSDFSAWNNTLYVYGIADSTVITKYDNVKLTHYSAYNEELSFGWTDSENYIYPLVSKMVDGAIESKTKVIGNYSNLCLVTAVYNPSGALERLWTDTTAEDGYLTCNVEDADYVKSGNIVRTFLFDSITSAIPYVEKAEFIIE